MPALITPIVYIMLVRLAALLAMPLRLYKTGIAAVVLVGVNLIVISQVATAPAATDESSPRLRVLIANIQHGNGDQDALARLIAEGRSAHVGLIELTPTWASGIEPALANYPARRLAPEEGA